MATGRSNIVDIEATLVHETEKAVLLDAGGDKPVWVPKSVIEDNEDGTWSLPEEVALEKGLI